MRTITETRADGVQAGAAAQPGADARAAEERAGLARALAASRGDWRDYERGVRAVAVRAGLRRLADWLGFSRP